MLKKSWLPIFLFATLLFMASFMHKNDAPQQPLKTIIIDAGHGLEPGGGHNGAKGTYSYEDDICLAVAKKLVRQIAEKYPNIRIVETRPTKNITSLHDRADIANQNKGDLFVSIHVNAMPPIQKREFLGYRSEKITTGKGKHKKRKTVKVPQYRYYSVPDVSAKGTQTYIWGAHKNDDKEIAVRENAPMLAEENYQEKYGNIDVNSPEFIAYSLVKTQQFTKRSSTLANMVEQEFVKVGRISGGPHQRQVGIWVLQATAMPSILVETGFITNPQEEDYLNSDTGQEEIASCITNALGNYITWLQKKQSFIDGKASSGLPMQKDSTTLSFLQQTDLLEKKRLSR